MIKVLHSKEAVDWRDCKVIEPCGQAAFYVKERPMVTDIIRADDCIPVGSKHIADGELITCGSCGAVILEPPIGQLEIDGGFA